MQELVWQIAGEQGQGLDSTSDIFATVCNRYGYYIYAYKTFASRIKGGHTNFTVRVSTKKVQAPAPAPHVLVCMDQDSINRLAKRLAPGGVLIADSHFKPEVPEGVRLISIPMTEIARELKNALFKNMVALGASAALLGLSLDGFKAYVTEKWGRRGDEVVQGNWAALEQGFEQALALGEGFQLAAGDGEAKMLMTGNDATALGALAGGCRLIAAYPITPASEVMEVGAVHLPRYGGAVIQAEDELASIGMIIGAGFAGIRALTATSGPGISLMQEYLGLASMAEIPCVIVDTQRGGPSTGMPTKQEQSDVLSLIYGGHGEAPRIVLAPGTAEEIFYDTALAFNLADNYHCPVLIASDLGLALWQQTVEEIDYDEVSFIDRGPLPDVAELEAMGRDVFERYAKTESGVSPRSLPGMKHGQFLATGAEHGPFGKVTEDPANRVYMMDRRLGRIKHLEIDGKPVPGLVHKGPEDAEILLIGYGSTFGAVAEGAEILANEGFKVATVQIRVLNPLPVNELRQLTAQAGQTFVVEQNALGQLAFLMKAEEADAKPIHSILKYDGTLLLPQEVAERVRSAIAEGVGV